MSEYPKVDLLKDWLDEELPDLLDELNSMTFDQAIIKLNFITGLSIPNDEHPDIAAMQYLIRLREMYKDTPNVN